VNNFDRYDQALLRSPREAAALAIGFSGQCGSKSNAWNWANRAIEAAAQAGITLIAGSASWPDLDAMQRQLDAIPHA